MAQYWEDGKISSCYYYKRLYNRDLANKQAKF